ncbi:MAG: bifunctional 3'-5' exonuclease/DNA polymerase [Mycobacteriales bacterium]
MRYVVVAGPDCRSGSLRAVDDRGAPVGPVEVVDDVVAAVDGRERAGHPRWVWPATDDIYPELLAAGVVVGRCVDLALTEGILLGHEGRWGESRSLAAAWARLADLPVPDDPPPRARPAAQQALFDTEPASLPGGAAALDAAVAVHADQLRRVLAAELPDRLALLVAAESACALVAAEMTRAGVPWRADVHDALLTAQLGPRPAAGLPPRRLTELADQVAAAFGGVRVNPDSPAEVVQAFARAGVPVSSARSFVLRRVEHAAVAPLLEYKELARLHAAHGWSWLDTWVRDGRFRPDWVVGGVVSGRWASRGGGALQIPHAVRRAVVADPGHLLVVADAAQLEPRVLAALAGDLRLAQAAAASDLYSALAADSFGGDRARAKVALLGTLYGATSGDAAPVLAVLRRRFPTAVGYVEAAARDGEAGRLVRSRLGRTCPPPSARWREAQQQASLPGAGEPEQARARQTARDRGRFTRNFVVQASAADWTAVLLAALRRRLVDGGAPGTELVFFQHDEVVLHCPQAQARVAAALLTEAAEEASQLVFGQTPVRFPLEIAAVACYADAK